jgi:hypothetical protein
MTATSQTQRACPRAADGRAATSEPVKPARTRIALKCWHRHSCVWMAGENCQAAAAIRACRRLEAAGSRFFQCAYQIAGERRILGIDFRRSRLAGQREISAEISWARRTHRTIVTRAAKLASGNHSPPVSFVPSGFGPSGVGMNPTRNCVRLSRDPGGPQDPRHGRCRCYSLRVIRRAR